MNEITLAKFCETHSQLEAARVLGCTQGAVWQALRADREIYIVDYGDGTFSAYEMKHLSGKRVRVTPGVPDKAA